MIKKTEVFKEDFSNLWIVTRLLEFNDRIEIAKTLIDYFQSKVIINPVFAENALIKLDQGSIGDLIEGQGRWHECGSFHLEFEKWNKFVHSRPLYSKGYGGWISIRNLPLDYWCKQTFEVIRAYFGDLEDIASETLKLLNVLAAKIKVKTNLYGFMPSTIEISDDKHGIIYYFGDFISLEPPAKVKEELFFKDFTNLIDLVRLNQVWQDNGASFPSLNSKLNFLLPSKIILNQV